MAHSFSGTGPGIQTLDGCSVEFYRQLPYMNELSDIESELSTQKAALELGCGTGRLCRRLQELGTRATGVDESAAMLAQLPPAVEGIESRIEELNDGRIWPAVLLPSHLINHPEESVRRSFVEAARRHIEPTGVFYVKRHSTQWLSTVQDGRIGESNGVAYFAENVLREGDLLTMTLRYEAFGQSWQQSFTTRALEKIQIEAILASCGFGNFRWLGKQELWVAATPSDA
jgi:2-polyprenyl-3-methyl-5-hydroxy-6-metoxy-1,4-benzoquinol methylase